MPNYTKLFNSIVTSTIWTEDDKTRILWITMLALADQNGEVHASIPGLARLAGIDMESTEKAIACFLSPDPYSRTPDNEGRRIAKIDGGWELLNHAKYRKMASKEDSKAATAERVRRHRERNAPVTLCNAPVTVSRDIAEAEAEADLSKDKEAISCANANVTIPKRTLFKKPALEEIAEYGNTLTPPFTNVATFLDYYESNGWKVGKNPMKDWKAAIRNWHSKQRPTTRPTIEKTNYQKNGQQFRPFD
jgi:hypothetical protein